MTAEPTPSPPPAPAAVTAGPEEVLTALGHDPARAVELAAALHGALSGAGGPGEARAALLLGQALVAHARLDDAEAHLLAAAQLYAAHGDPSGQLGALGALGKLQLDLGQLDAAAETLEATATLAADAGAAGLEPQATALNLLAAARHHQGRVAEATRLLHRALELREQGGHAVGMIQCLTNIGMIQGQLGQYREAVGSLTRAFTLYQTLPENFALVTPILHNLAHIHHLSGDDRLAAEVMEAAQRTAVASGSAQMQATAALNLGTFLLELQDYAAAAAQLNSALALSRSLGYRVGELSTLDALGSLYERTGEPGRAAAAFAQALHLALETGSVQGQVEARLNLGRLDLAAGKLIPARQNLTTALALAQETQLPQACGAAHEVLSALCEQEGDVTGALLHSRELRTLERSLFNAERDRQTRNLSIQFEVERAQQDARMARVRTQLEHEGRERAEEEVRERTAELARAQHEVVTRLAMAAEYRDDTTGEHTRRVGRSAARIARALGWSEARASVLGVAARLHDVGKIGIPDAVLLKPGRLTPSEYAHMQTHTLIGARILSGGRSDLLHLAEEIARTHHERWDGAGYPLGLRGDDIPLPGRIVAVADVFDALTQARPYKEAWTPGLALEEIAAQSGRHFDPAVVEVALAVLRGPGDGPAGEDAAEGGAPSLDREDLSNMLSVFEHLLVERTQELEVARREAERAAERMERMALTDSLTGLGNRWSFEQALDNLWPRTPDQAFTVISLDVDGLKAVNDTQGHAQGDKLLQAVARSFTRALLSLGTVYRIGGDEFAIICPHGAGPEVVQAVQEHAAAALREQGFGRAAVSLGMAAYPGDAQSAGDLLRLSDQRMYAQKVARRGGRAPARLA